MNNIENTQNNPFNRIDHWINNEKRLGSEEPDQVVLATVSKEGLPHSRVVALRQISEDSIVFFTQKNTKKVDDLAVNPYASMTLWLPLQQSEVVLDGAVEKLTYEESNIYWKALSRERQLRFIVNSQRLEQSISSTRRQNEAYNAIQKEFENKDIPMHDSYIGFSFIANSIYFYKSCDNSFPEKIQYTQVNSCWEVNLSEN